MKKKLLFILKERQYSASKVSYGLINSATHVANYLSKEGFDCKVVSVVDANSIDREVHLLKPDIVILEALWCPVEKLKELIELHKYKHIKWIVRVHSDIGFLSCESQAMKLINGYIDLNKGNLILSLNSEKFVKSLSNVTRHKFTYLPNIICTTIPSLDITEENSFIDIGCFGAMRLLKNQCFQAMCAMEAADRMGKTLRFHITPNPNEKEPISTNLVELFKDNRHELIIHEWMDNNKFQHLIKQMDIGLQISYTESFNIVSAEFINNNKLIVVSDAIDWLSPFFRTSSTDYESAISKIIYMYKHRNSEWLKNISRDNLRDYNYKARNEWINFLKPSKHEHGKYSRQLGRRN